MSEAVATSRPAPRRPLPTLLVEGLRLFFPAAAIHALLLPLLWTTLFAFGLPFANGVPPGQWHAHEMIFGTYGAALAGFLTSAVPEWTDTRTRQGRSLLWLLALWLPGRAVGLLGIDALILPAAATDIAFLSLLFWYVVRALWQRRSTRHASFAAWTALLIGAEAAIRISWWIGAMELSGRLLHAALAVFLVFFALAVARINVVVVNLALDPSGETTPYRPHPGRQNLAAGMASLYALTALAMPNSQAPAYLALAAAAAFFDRLAEWFIGRAVLRSEVLALAAANGFAGCGFGLIGLAGLGAPIATGTGLHVLSVGSLGLAVTAVFVIAGLRHTGHDLTLPWQAHTALALMASAAFVRVLPELGLVTGLVGLHTQMSSALWAASFGVWLHGFLPKLSQPAKD